MITNLFQAIGVVFTLLVIAFIGLAAMYISYILGISFIILALVFVVYHALSIIRGHK